METHSNAIELSTTKPNVLVGPNGSDKYVRWNEELWFKEGSWYSKECKYLHGVNVEGRLNPILNNESLNLIETVPGYVAKVCEVIGL